MQRGVRLRARRHGQLGVLRQPDGRDIHPTRGPIVAPTFKENERVLAGFLDGHEDEGPSAGRSTLLGREIAAAKGWTEPVAVEVADEATDTKGEEAK